MSIKVYDFDSYRRERAKKRRMKKILLHVLKEAGLSIGAMAAIISIVLGMMALAEWSLSEGGFANVVFWIVVGIPLFGFPVGNSIKEYLDERKAEEEKRRARRKRQLARMKAAREEE